jgi:hypothetical protein
MHDLFIINKQTPTHTATCCPEFFHISTACMDLIMASSLVSGFVDFDGRTLSTLDEGVNPSTSDVWMKDRQEQQQL